MKTIKEFQGQYRFLSNFWLCDVVYDGIRFPSAENAYQAAKCAHNSDRIAFKNITPGQAKRKGKQVIIRGDWEQVKKKVMKEVVLAKFQQNIMLLIDLKNTGDAVLEEGNRWGDTYWGICRGIGENNLGKILMEVRQEINSRKPC
jgi:hypothetical protein